jgi:hypothetical protein
MAVTKKRLAAQTRDEDIAIPVLATALSGRIAEELGSRQPVFFSAPGGCSKLNTAHDDQPNALGPHPLRNAPSCVYTRPKENERTFSGRQTRLYQRSSEILRAPGWL